MNDQPKPLLAPATPIKDELAKLQAMKPGESYVENLTPGDACRLHGKARRHGMKISTRMEPKTIGGMRVWRIE